MRRSDTDCAIPPFLGVCEMSDIKTKENTRDIKVLDRSAAAMHNVKRAGVRTRNHIANLTDDAYVSPEEYTEEKLKGAVEDGAFVVEEKTRKQVKKVSDKIKERRREKRASFGIPVVLAYGCAAGPFDCVHPHPGVLERTLALLLRVFSGLSLAPFFSSSC